MSYSVLAKECIRSLQDKRAVHLGSYQVELDKADLMLQTFCQEPIPGYEKIWSHQRRRLKAFWMIERERAWIASLGLRKRKGAIRSHGKRSREDGDGTDGVTDSKRCRAYPSIPAVFEPTCIQRAYRRHEPDPLFPRMRSKKGKQQETVTEKGSLETMRLDRSWKHIQNEDPGMFWKEKVETLCKDNPRVNVGKIRAELLVSKGRIRRPLPSSPPELFWRTDNMVFAEMKRKEKQDQYDCIPPDFARKVKIPDIRRVPSIHQTAQSKEPGDQPWIELNPQDTKRLHVLRTKLAGLDWPELSAIDSYIDDGSPATDDQGLTLAQTSQVSPVDTRTGWLTRTPRTKVTMSDAMRYCQLRAEATERFSQECVRYLHHRVHEERAFNLDLLSSTETFLGFPCKPEFRNRK